MKGMKIKGTLLIAVFILTTLTLVSAATVLTPPSIELVTIGDATATWVTDPTYGYVVQLTTIGQDSHAIVVIPYEVQLDAITALSFDYMHTDYHPDEPTHVLGPDIMLFLEVTDGIPTYYMAGRGGADESTTAWSTAEAVTGANFAVSSTWWYVICNENYEPSGSVGEVATFGELQTALTGATVVGVAVNLNPPGTDPVSGTVLVDYITINTDTYDLDYVVEMTSTDIEWPYATDRVQEFNVRTTSDTGFASVRYNFVAEDAELGDVTSFEYWDVAIPTPAWATVPLQDGTGTELGNLVGYFGPEPGFPMDADWDVTTKFRVKFATAKTYPVTMSLVDMTNEEYVLYETSFELDVYPATVVLDSEYYKMGDTVNIIVYDGSVGVRPLVKDTIEVTVTSDLPDQIPVTLTETDVSTGIYTGSFNLVDVDPGANDLWVDDESIITVQYITEEYDPSPFEAVAFVDTAAPTMTPDEELEDLITSDTTPTITISVEDLGSGLASVSMKLNDEVVGFKSWPIAPAVIYPQTEELISYTVPLFEELSDDLHEVEVTVSDAVGNTDTYTWTFTIDALVPTVLVEVDPDPVGHLTGDTAGLVTFTLTFSEEMEVAPSVTFGLESPYDDGLIFVVSTLNDIVWTATTTIVEASLDGLNTISVSDAEDLAGNPMLEDISTTFTIDTTAPVAPSELVETVTDVSIQLDWTAATDVDGTGVETYDIYRKIDEEPSFPVDALVSLDSSITTYTDYSAFLDDTYDYKITAVDFAGNEASATISVEFEPGDVIAREIALSEGWNLISLPLIPDDSSITVILADVMENVESVWSYDEGWSTYNPALPMISTLTDLVDGEGYWVKMTADDSVIVYGVELPEPGILPPVYSVVEGWNLIGFKSIDEMPMATYLTTIPETVLASSVCYGWDATDQEYEMVSIGAPELLTPVFNPGKGYWLYLTEDASIAPPVYTVE